MFNKIHTRFAILAYSLIGFFLATLVLLFVVEQQSLDTMLDTWVKRKQTSVNKVLELTAMPVCNLSKSLSTSAELGRCISARDTAGIARLIGPAVLLHEAAGAEIFDMTRKILCAVGDSSPRVFPPIPAGIFSTIDKSHWCHCFISVPDGVVELIGVSAGAPNDPRHSPVQSGYFIASKKWDDDFLGELLPLTLDSVVVADSIPGSNASRLIRGTLVFYQNLPDWQGKPARVLRITTHPFGLGLRYKMITLRLWILLTFAAIAIFLLSMFLRLWVAKPIRSLSRSMESGDPDCIRELCKKPTEFGSFARLASEFYDQTKSLTREISERVKTEVALRQSEERYRMLVEVSPDGIVMSDMAGKIMLCNRNMALLQQYGSSYELCGKSIFDSVGEEYRSKFRDHFEEILQTGLSRNKEYYFLKKGGDGGFHSEISISLIKDSAGVPQAYFLVIRDITSRKQAEQENLRLQEQLRAVYKLEAIGQLAGGVAHDFNNILGAISGYADIISHRYEEDPKLVKYSSMILSAATRAADLTSKLLTFARKGKLQMVPFNVNHLLSDAGEILERTIDKNITIILHLDATDGVITGDPGQFQGAIMNLALNARDAMPGGGKITFTTTNVVLDEKFARSRVYMVTPGAYVKVTAEDSGVGMEKQVMAHLFEPFFTTKDIGKGTGLGLASVYGSVKSHNGYIDVESSPGEGSRFIMYFPVLPEATPPAGQGPLPIIKGKGNILVVDDDNYVCDALREMLSWLGYSVAMCTDALEAVEYYRKNWGKTDLVILDMMMPGMNGRDCFKELLEINAKVKVVLSTGYNLEEDRQEILKDGFVGILHKPFVSAQLAKIIHEVFAG